jgi:hypothetical protein
MSRGAGTSPTEGPGRVNTLPLKRCSGSLHATNRVGCENQQPDVQSIAEHYRLSLSQADIEGHLGWLMARLAGFAVIDGMSDGFPALRHPGRSSSRASSEDNPLGAWWIKRGSGLCVKAQPLPAADAPVAVRIGAAYLNLGNTSPFDVSHHPAMSVPCGRVDGLPVGLMLVGRQWEEATIYRAALERSGDWREW